jgi:cold-inducible RNA-binding protein
MSLKLFVANLSYNVDEAQLRAAFEPYGPITEAFIATDRETGRPRGFAFVTFESDEQARAAIAGLNGTQLDGRPLTVNEARAKEATGTTAPGSVPGRTRNFGPDRRAGAFQARNKHRR